MRTKHPLSPLSAIRSRTRARMDTPGRPDAGFTLVEVLVAIVLLSMVLVAGGGFMIKAMTSSAALTGRQGAVTVANQTMERVRAVNPTFSDATGISPLVYGRSQTASVNAWNDAATKYGIDTSTTYTGSGITAYDRGAYSSTGLLNLPITQTVTTGSQSYTVTTLIGTCVRPVDADSAATPSPSAACVKTLQGYEMFRVVVLVTWTPPTGGCSGSACAYSVTSLVDPTVDPVFNTNRRPVANPDTATVASGQSVQMGVTANDSGVFPLSGAVTIVSSPANGTATVNPGTNIVTYRANTGYSGSDTFSYSVTDTTGLTSNVATDTISVTPVAVNDTFSVTAGSAATLVNVLGNDLGTGLTLKSITTPTLGTATISGNGINYTPPTAASGITTISYTAKDVANQPETGTLTVTVKPYVSPNDPCFNLLSLGVYSFMPLVSGTGPYTLQIVSVTGANLPSAPTIQGFSLSGLYLNETITFTVTDANGVVSDQQTVTVTLRIC